jgi:ABC-type transport system involved in cytochrome c biogenesis permease component
MSKNLNGSLLSCWRSQIAEVIGDWNPQLLLELKSRVNWRSVSLSILLSIGIQSLILISKFTKIHYPYRSYCKTLLASKCVMDHPDTPLINWSAWWADISITSGAGIAIDLSYVMFIGMFVAGVYALASNFNQEKKLGTLLLVQLSPQKARSIIVGKVLGVPILIYLAVLCALPLQIYATHLAQISRANVVTWDLAMLGLGLIFYLGAMAATLWLKAIPIILTALTIPLSYVAVALSLRWHGKYDDSVLQWYGIRLSNHPSSFLLMAAMSGLGIYWLYKTLVRYHHQPTASILSRAQSYIWSLTYHLFLLGFCTSYSYDRNTYKLAPQLSFDFGLHTYTGGGSDDTAYGQLPGAFSFLLWGWLMLLIPVLLPSTQALTNWYRHRRSQQGWWKTRLWDDRSPATLAVLVNLMIASLVWILPIAINSGSFFAALIWIVSNLVTGSIFMAICTTIAQLKLFWPVAQRRFWSLGVFGLLLFPLFAHDALRGYADTTQLIWIFGNIGVFFLGWMFWPVLITMLCGLVWSQRCLSDKLAEISFDKVEQDSELGLLTDNHG